MPPKQAKTTATKTKVTKKATATKKTTATKKKKATTKKKPAAKKKQAAKEVESKYDLLGQKRDAPDESDPLRKFYASLRTQNPKSTMAEIWLMEHGLLGSPEAQRDAYARMLKSKGKTVPKLVIKKKKVEVKEEVKSEREEAKEETKVETKEVSAPKPMVLVDDDSD